MPRQDRHTAYGATMPTEMSADAYHALANEQSVQDALVEAIEALGGVWAHITDSRGMHAEGVPDLIAVIPASGVVAFFECKGPQTRTRVAQTVWLGALARCTMVVSGLVRPVPRIGEVSQDEAISLLRGDDPWS